MQTLHKHLGYFGYSMLVLWNIFSQCKTFLRNLGNMPKMLVLFASS